MVLGLADAGGWDVVFSVVLMFLNFGALDEQLKKNGVNMLKKTMVLHYFFHHFVGES